MLSPINGVKPNELIVDLYLSTHCNFSCNYCYLNDYDVTPASLTRYGIDSIFDALNEARYPINLCVLGGEPTIAHLYSHTLEVALRNTSIKTVTVFTNGSSPVDEMPGVHYMVSIHPDFFKPIYIKNFKNIKNKTVKLMLPKNSLGRAKTLLDILRAAGIEPIPEYIHCGRNFELGEVIDEFENIPAQNFNGRLVSKRAVMEEDLWDAARFRCFQNEVSISPTGEIQMFCDGYRTHDLDYLKEIKIELRPCRFKRKCGCFEQVKI